MSDTKLRKLLETASIGKQIGEFTIEFIKKTECSEIVNCDVIVDTTYEVTLKSDDKSIAVYPTDEGHVIQIQTDRGVAKSQVETEQELESELRELAKKYS